MSEAHAARGALTRTDSTVFERLADGAIGVAVVSFALALGTLAELAPLDATVLGLSMIRLYGAALVFLSVVVLALGLGSRLGIVSTHPDRSAGLLPGVAFLVIGAGVGGLVGAGPLGLGAASPILAVVAALLFGAVTVLPREDVGSTIPPAVVTAVPGFLFLAGVVGVDWQWSPGAIDGGLTATAAVPIAVVFCSLLSIWAAGKARGSFGARGRETGAYLLVYVNAGMILAVMVSIVLFVVAKGAPYALRGIGLTGQFPFVQWPFVMRPHVPLGATRGGILPAIVGTAWLVIGATLFAVPLGVGAAVFLTEYAEEGRFTRVVEVATNALWSTPSVVYGLFGAAFLIPRIAGEESLVSGMLVLGFMLLPLVMITSREAILSVPDEYRDASAALGVSRWETVRSVVLPAAMPGVVTGVILGVGRIAGETAPLILVLGSPLNSISDALVPDFFATQAALPTQIWAIIAAGVSGSTAKGWATAFVLLLVVLLFYGVGIASRTYFRRKLHHE